MNKPTIVVTGTPNWTSQVEAIAARLGFDVAQYVNTESYLPRLIDAHAAMVIVDGANPGWKFWTTSPQVNAATRRIPIVIVSDDPAVREAGNMSGANFTLSPAEINAALPGIIEQNARVITDKFREEIADQCAEPLPPEALEAIEKFNRGEYYKQHDMLEALWMKETGPIRDLYRAILQVGIAYYQVTLGNPRGALKMILRCIQWLNILPDICQGVDIAALRADADRLRAALEAWPEDRDMAEFDQSLLGKVRLVDQLE